MKKLIVGLRWDFYTPAVEAQITRDLIALKHAGATLAVVSEPAAAKVLSALGVEACPFEALAYLWVTYRTQEDKVEAPEHATQVIERDLYVSPSRGGLLDTHERPGYYMKPQGTPIAPTLPLNRPMPNTVGPVDPMIVTLWG